MLPMGNVQVIGGLKQQFPYNNKSQNFFLQLAKSTASIKGRHEHRGWHDEEKEVMNLKDGMKIAIHLRNKTF